MSSSAPVVTSVSMATTGVMECLTALTAQTREPAVSIEIVLFPNRNIFFIYDFLDQLIFLFDFPLQLLDPRGCATMRVSSSVSQMGLVSRPHGSVMVIQTARTAATNTTPARLAPAPPHSSAVIMETACYTAGSVTVTMTAGTWVMKETVPHRPFAVQAGSGNVLATVCASTWPQCVTTLLTVPTVLTSPLFAVSLISSRVSQAEISSFVYHKHLIIELHFPNMLTASNLIPHDEQDHYPDLILVDILSAWKQERLHVGSCWVWCVCLCVPVMKIMHVCDLMYIT